MSTAKKIVEKNAAVRSRYTLGSNELIVGKFSSSDKAIDIGESLIEKGYDARIAIPKKGEKFILIRSIRKVNAYKRKRCTCK